MSAQVFCPKCDRSCRIKEELLGRRVRCPGCQEVFKAEEIPVAESDDDLPDFTPPPMPALKEQESRKPEQHRPPSGSVKPMASPGNPFTESSKLPPVAPVDTTAFDFDLDRELPPPAKKSSAAAPGDGRDDEDHDRPRSKKKPAADTEYGWEKKNAPPDNYTSRSSIPALRDDAAPAKRAPLTPEPGLPFAFGDDKPSAPAAKPPAKPREEEKDEPPPKRKAAPREEDEDRPRRKTQLSERIENDDAAFLGLQDFEGSAEQPAALPAKKPDRPYFHVREAGSEPRLYRVFTDDGQLIFITVAAGREIAAAEQILASGKLDGADKKLRNWLADLDERPIDDLADDDPDGFRISAAKLLSVSINPPLRKLLRKGPVTLLLKHKSKGEMSFEFPGDDDVDRALDYLPDLVDDVLEVKVKWDKQAKAFVARA